MTVRIGVLGCARIAAPALLRPARRVAGAEVVAIGSRSAERAERFARRHRIPRSYGSYDEVLADPEVDAVYVPLPNALHARWSIAALEAGKHVLCEKPLASDETQARAMADAARAKGLVAMEAFHYRYHPVNDRVRAIVASGELGELRTLSAQLAAPILLPRDIRWDPALGGGAAMDMGCYAVNAVRSLAGAEPEVLTAAGALTRRGVDRRFEATLAFPRGVQARVRASMVAAPWARLTITGTRGSLDLLNPFLPQLFYRLRVRVDGAQRSERTADGSTYVHQLEAFVDCVVNGTAPRTPFQDAVGTMRVLDRIRSIIGVRT